MKNKTVSLALALVSIIGFAQDGNAQEVSFKCGGFAGESGLVKFDFIQTSNKSEKIVFEFVEHENIGVPALRAGQTLEITFDKKVFFDGQMVGADCSLIQAPYLGPSDESGFPFREFRFSLGCGAQDSLVITQGVCGKISN